MMRAMKTVGLVTTMAAGALLVTACGAAAKRGELAETCPDGTVMRGGDCVAEPTGGGGGGGSRRARPKSEDDEQKPQGDEGTSSAPSGSSTKYDEEAIQAELKRAARQIKANCGSATDDEGKAGGPWGKTTASVTLGRNGHVGNVSLPAPYDGQPVAVCVIHALQKIQFSPYGGSEDATVPLDIELVRPKH